MTDKKKILAEIESRIQECKEAKIDSPYYDGLIFAFEEINEFINSLPEEPVTNNSVIMYGMSASVGFEEAVKNRKEYKEWQGSPDIQRELIDFAKFGNQYQEPVSEDLGEYVNELSKQFPEVSFAKLSRIAVRVAKWQKEHDIEKTCKWLNDNVPIITSNIALSDERYTTILKEETVDYFRKTLMED